jgi:hypothetical protein
MDQPSSGSSSRHLGRTIVAAVILIVAVWVLLGSLIHIAAFLFGTVLVVAAVIAVIWALRVLL